MAHVSLILLDDVEKLGLAGMRCMSLRVMPCNYLIPRGLAAKATPGTLRLIESRKAIIAARRQPGAGGRSGAGRQARRNRAFDSDAGDGRRAALRFGHDRMIADLLAAQGIKVEHSRIKVEPAIKTLGKFEVDVKLHSDVAAKLSVWVVRG